jgi:hypothetical protein
MDINSLIETAKSFWPNAKITPEQFHFHINSGVPSPDNNRVLGLMRQSVNGKYKNLFFGYVTYDQMNSGTYITLKESIVAQLINHTNDTTSLLMFDQFTYGGNYINLQFFGVRVETRD